VVVGYNFMNTAEIPVDTASLDYSSATSSSGAATASANQQVYTSLLIIRIRQIS
jgi:hypothetical protein